MQNNLAIRLLKIFSSDTKDSFISNIYNTILAFNINNFYIWEVNGNICEPVSNIHSNLFATFDIYEFGYANEDFSNNLNINIGYFDQNFIISAALFIRHNNRILYAITFQDPISDKNAELIKSIVPYLGKRASELASKERQMDLYVDYQKKVDFVKKASTIFKALEIEEVISMSLSFFMEAFSADAICVLFDDKFYGIGFNETDLINHMSMNNMNLKEFMLKNNDTLYVENEVISPKYNIINTFFIYDPVANLRFSLFNIIIDTVPDKDFSYLVTSIISIATENAINHQKITKFKIEETEISLTADILNKFVHKTVSLPNNDNMYGISYPARNAGGDFLYLTENNGDYTFCVTDVCGKGYAAAILTVALNIFTSNFDNNEDFATQIMEMNKFLISKNFNDRFITALFCKYHSNTRELEYISCGHDPAVIMTGDNTQYLTSDYLPLGLLDEQYTVKKIKLEKNSMIFSYSDGLIEYLTLDELIDLVKSLSYLPPKNIVETLYSKLVTDRNLQKDDFTCLIMKV